jgi:hypothetical protein
MTFDNSQFALMEPQLAQLIAGAKRLSPGAAKLSGASAAGSEPAPSVARHATCDG